MGPLLNRRLAKAFIRHYGGTGGHNLDPLKGELGYALFHYAMIVNCRPTRVLCIGSMKGFIPALCALACKDNGRGHVDFVDAGFDQTNPNHWGGIGFWKTVDPAKHFSYGGISPWITTYIMTSQEFARTSKTAWEYIYIDADHSYEGVERDYRLFWTKLKKGGFMSFHDILLKRHPHHDNFGVWKFWENVPQKSKLALPFTYSSTLPSGLGIVQKT